MTEEEDVFEGLSDNAGLNNENNVERTASENQGIVESTREGSDLLANHKYNKYELTKRLKQQLDHLPEILEFIQKLQKCIEKQKKKLKKIKCKEKIKTKTVCTQTDNGSGPTTLEEVATAQKTLTQEITEAAQQAVQHNGFVYEETSGLYYDYNSGYYYNAEFGLYYDGNTGTYLKYNQDTKEYEFHSQASNVTTTNQNRPEVSRGLGLGIGKQKHSKHKRKDKSYQDEVHVNKNSNCNVDELVCSFNELKLSALRRHAVDYAKQYPPCMRIIIEETSIATIKQGSLHMITYEGGSIGREGAHSILLPEINNSKHHVKITFDADKGAYFVTDVGSRNGTYLNGKRMAPAKVESDPFEVMHGSRIQIGSTTLLCHVHSGTQTCGHCEPGLIQIKESNSEATNKDDTRVTKSNDHKHQLKQLRKKFGLLQNDQGKVNPGAGYTDRAQVRREKVGSQNPHEKTQTASLHESIACDNKGFKLLAKMGWKEGQALGKDSQGRLEPVELVSNPGTSGMGSASDTQVIQQIPERAVIALKMPKQNAWMKAQERYKQVGDQSIENIFDLADF